MPLLDLGADEEQHQRQQQPDADRDRQVLAEPAAPRRPPSRRRAARAEAAVGARGPPPPVAARERRRSSSPRQDRAEPRGRRDRWCTGAARRHWRGAVASVDAVRAIFGGWPGHRLHIVTACRPAHDRRRHGRDEAARRRRSTRSFAVHHRAQRTVAGLDQSALLDIAVQAVQEATPSAGRRRRGGRLRDPLPDRSAHRDARSWRSTCRCADMPFADDHGRAARAAGVRRQRRQPGRARRAPRRRGRGASEAVVLTHRHRDRRRADPRRRALPRRGRRGRRARPHRDRHGRPALPGQLPQPRLRRGAAPRAPRWRARRPARRRAAPESGLGRAMADGQALARAAGHRARPRRRRGGDRGDRADRHPARGRDQPASSTSSIPRWWSSAAG